MAGRQSDPEILKAQAQELLKKAKKIEDKRFKEVGQLVYDYFKNDFSGLEIEKFKNEVKEIFKLRKKADSEAEA
jgi:hypothetical protein